MIQKFSLVLSFLAIAFFIAPYAAQAQKVDRGYAKAMPDIKFMPKAEFEMKTTAHEDVPLDEEAKLLPPQPGATLQGR